MQKSRLLTSIEISRSALDHNLKSLTRMTGGRKLAVCIKANAYGHGLAQMLALLGDREDVAGVTVHSLHEAIFCCISGWDRSIIVLGPISLDSLEAVLEYDLEPVLVTREAIDRLGVLAAKRQKRVRTHLKLETGTNRQGVTEKELSAIARLYKKHAFLKKPYGASMHFANIEDTTNHEYARHQLSRFHKMIRRMTELGIKPTIRHTACSAALILFDKTKFDLVRPGIAMYGYWPSKETYLSYQLAEGESGINDVFRPILSWKTRVTQIKELAADSFVGYGCSYRTTSPTRLALLPIGYSEGYDRSLSSVAHVLIGGKRAPIRGRVCMNLAMADITHIPRVKLEDPVVLIGKQKGEEISADQMANWSGTISYEALARLSPLLPRVIVD